MIDPSKRFDSLRAKTTLENYKNVRLSKYPNDVNMFQEQGSIRESTKNYVLKKNSIVVPSKFVANAPSLLASQPEYKTLESMRRGQT